MTDIILKIENLQKKFILKSIWDVEFNSSLSLLFILLLSLK